MRIKSSLLIVVLAAAAVVVQFAAQAEEPVTHNYVGAESCKMCHKSAKSGNQYGKWQEGQHSKAFETLATEAAIKVAADLGLEGSPQELSECLRCHVTAHGVDPAQLEKKYKPTDGVGCESCHGPGKDYKGKKVMKDQAAAIAAGMVIPTIETCTACHNEDSPTFKAFDFDEMVAKIAHPIPPKAE